MGMCRRGVVFLWDNNESVYVAMVPEGLYESLLNNLVTKQHQAPAALQCGLLQLYSIKSCITSTTSP